MSSSSSANLALGPHLAQSLRLAIAATCAVAVSALVVVNSGGFSPIQPVAWTFGGMLGLNALPLADRAQTLASIERANPRADDPATMHAARSLATKALHRDPLIAPAWRALAIVEASRGRGHSDRGYELLQVSSFVSRRDTGTSALLFEEFVKRGDITAGLRQLDLAMRRSPQARQALLPVLVQGLVDPELRVRLVDALKGKAAWRGEFLRQLALTPPSDDAVVAFLELLPPALIEQNRPDLQILVAGLIQAGRLSAARALAQRLLIGQALVTNGGFESPNAAPPLDWALQATAEYDAVQGKYGGSIDGAQALYLRSRRAQGTEVARQILFLRPGQARISSRSGTQDGERPASVSLSVACVGPRNSVGERLGELKFTGGGARKSAGTGFVVPRSGCPAQWLLVTVEGGTSEAEVASWIDNVAITQFGNSQRGRPLSVSE